MHKRPIIHLEPSESDRKIDMAITIVTMLLIAIPTYYIYQLPDIIPSHFDMKGEVDGYGTKYYIWIMPIMGVIFYFGFKYLLKKPHIYNYPSPVTEENAEKLYRGGTSLMRYVLLFSQLTFLVITIAMIYSAFYPDENFLGPWFTIGIILLGVLTPIGLAYKMSDMT